MPKSVESISIIRSTEGYVLQLEDEDGELREFAATLDQLDLLGEEIERHLLSDEDDDDDAMMETDEEEGALSRSE